MSILSTVQHELRELRSRLESIEKSVRQISNDEFDADLVLDRVLAMTKELFQTDAQISEQQDPEIFDHRYLVLEVTSNGPVELIIEQYLSWHRALSQIPGIVPGRYTLSIIPEE